MTCDPWGVRRSFKLVTSPSLMCTGYVAGGGGNFIPLNSSFLGRGFRLGLEGVANNTRRLLSPFRKRPGWIFLWRVLGDGVVRVSSPKEKLETDAPSCETGVAGVLGGELPGENSPSDPESEELWYSGGISRIGKSIDSCFVEIVCCIFILIIDCFYRILILLIATFPAHDILFNSKSVQDYVA